MGRIASFCRNLLRATHVERELDEELRATLDLLVDEKLRAGTPYEAARLEARRELGSIDAIKASVRDVRAGAFVEVLVRDARYGLRLLTRNPLFALTATLSLAVGIGATTAIFTVGEALLLRPPAAVSEPHRLVDIGRAADGFRIGTVSYPTYVAIRERSSTLQGVYAYPVWPSAMALGTRDGVERIYGERVSANYFSVLGSVPAQGRLFDDRDGRSVLVLSYRLWVSRFNSNPAIVGETVRLNRAPFTVVGVAANGFQGTTIRKPDVWIPWDDRPESSFQDRGGASFLLGARLEPGASRAQAALEIDTLGRLLEREYPDQNRGLRLRVAALSPSPDMRGPLAIFIVLLFTIVISILAVACTNLTGILLARSASRRREFAMRMAIGAGRGRIVRQLLVETLLLFIAACAAGLLLARWAATLLVLMLPSVPVPVGVSLALDSRAFGFAAGVSLIAAVLSGLMPALQASKIDLVSAMREQPPRRIGRMRLRNTFVIAQVALSILLIVVGGLFAHALSRSTSSHPGFDSERVEVADIDLSIAGYSDITGPVFGRELLEQIRALPGVGAATLAFAPPGAFEGLGLGISVEDSSNGGPRSLDAAGNIVAPGYFAALGIPLLAGRDFAPSDRLGTQLVAILSETTARRLWPGRDPRAGVGAFISRAAEPGTTTPLQVVGIARDVASSSLIDGARDLLVYIPWEQNYHPRMSIVMRANNGRSLRPLVAKAIAAIDANLPIVVSATLGDRMRAGQTPQRIVASLSGGLGLLGVLLSGIGIYGVTAYAVATRAHEIGVRLALGARLMDVVTLVFGHAMFLVAIGGAIGLTIAAAASRVLRALLFGIPTLDPVSFGGAAILFVVVAFAACYVPLRRATRIGIADAVRWE